MVFAEGWVQCQSLIGRNSYVVPLYSLQKSVCCQPQGVLSPRVTPPALRPPPPTSLPSSLVTFRQTEKSDEAHPGYFWALHMIGNTRPRERCSLSLFLADLQFLSY